MVDGFARGADSAGMRSQPGRVGLPLIFGVATALGVFSTFQAYNYVSFFTERKPSFPMLLALNVTYWYAWAALVPGILWLARRYRFGRNTWKRAAAAHACGVLFFTFLHAVLTVSCRVPIAAIFGTTRSMTWWQSFQELFFLNFDWEMMTYWAVVGLSHALDFYRDSQEQRVAAAQLGTRLAEARLQTLQSQLHPHFLFNTLHTISALMHRDTEAADAMLARLSDLLRLSLDRIATQQVTLKEEVDFLQKYLEIERTRFGDRLVVRVDVEPETLDASVPNLLLQPLVENAIRHGIAQKVGGGLLEIRATRDGGELCLLVRDTGPGLSAQKLSALNTGVGLTNTRSRLEELFPDRHRFEFHEPPEGGLAVKIGIPFVVHPDSNPGVEMESVA
jgi:two-component system, LytTR family, sensor kinase